MNFFLIPTFLITVFVENAYASPEKIFCRYIESIISLIDENNTSVRSPTGTFRTIESLESQLTKQQLETLAYPRSFYHRARGNVEGLSGKKFVGIRKDTQLREIQLQHAKYFYLRSIAEALGDTPENVAELRKLEDLYFRRTNNWEVLDSLESEIDKTSRALGSLPSLEVTYELRLYLEQYLELQRRVFAKLEDLDTSQLVKGFWDFEGFSTEHQLASVLQKKIFSEMKKVTGTQGSAELLLSESFQVFGVEVVRGTLPKAIDGGAPIVPIKLYEDIIKGRPPTAFSPDPNDFSSVASRAELHKQYLSDIDLERQVEIQESFQKWSSNPLNFEILGPISRVRGTTKELDPVYLFLFEKLNNPTASFELLLEFEKDVLSISRKYGISTQEAARVVLDQSEKAHGFRGLHKVESFVPEDEWFDMISNGKLFRDENFHPGDTHGLDTHRVQMYMLARLIDKHPEKFTIDGERVLASDIYRNMAYSDYKDAFHESRSAFQVFFDIFFQNNFNSPAYLVRVRDLLGISPWD